LPFNKLILKAIPIYMWMISYTENRFYIDLKGILCTCDFNFSCLHMETVENINGLLMLLACHLWIWLLR